MLEFQAGNHQKLLIVIVVIIYVEIAFCISVAPCAKSVEGIVPLQCMWEGAAMDEKEKGCELIERRQLKSLNLLILSNPLG